MSLFSDIDGVIKTSSDINELQNRLMEEFALSPHDDLFNQASKIFLDLLDKDKKSVYDYRMWKWFTWQRPKKCV